MNFPDLLPSGRFRDFFNFNDAKSLSKLMNFDEADWIPAAEITEDDKEFLVKLEVPEVKKKDMKVEVVNGALCISGERKYEKKDKKLHRVERYYGSFERSFSLPDNVDPASVKAESKDGVLSIHLKKTEASAPAKQTIAID
ncbi:MAG: Hsp20/alpha crystallin family protein [Gammaproteobacteria bacterium]|nr:Hsp20/alpha crystallin family protein [Gammaproteobacteria bacterium]NNC98202.1 Hsp20/alpha crystallin family protein [Gammaproteobacteria bacterium]NNM14850.1 Hsp20/alpha crystallin family protein [Gammaproteobacteria bacterium]